MGIESEKILKFRYPGTKFFEADQRNAFFGRKEEIQNLTHSIKAHDIFVIYADSGIGKTSLLNAGLLPALEKERDTQQIVPINVRFLDYSLTPMQIFRKKLSEHMVSGGNLQPGDEDNVWKYFKSLRFRNESHVTEKLPLLIFDQFEEFFIYKREDREKFVDGLADLTNQYLPESIRDEMNEKFADRKPGPEEINYYAPPHLKLLFLIRADKLKLLDSLSKKIPLILRNRFHLKPLNVQQAEQAIVFPACLPQNDFMSPPFGYQDKAVTQMCNYLKNDEDEVESFQLQILCQELEKLIINRSGTIDHKGELEITIDDLGGEDGMNNITKNYYLNKINAIKDESMRLKAIELIEDRLIVEERRVSQAEFVLIKQGFSHELLDYLLNTTRLIRIDNDGYIEISHDRLLPSILKLRKKRKQEQHQEMEIARVKAEEEKKKQQQLKEIREEKKKLELDYLKDKVKKSGRLRVLLVLLVFLLISVIVLSVYADKRRIDSNLALAEYLIKSQEYSDADSIIHGKSFFSVFNFNYRKDSIENLEIIIHSLMAVEHRFDSFKNDSDSLFKIAYRLDTITGPRLDSIDSIINQNQASEAVVHELGTLEFDGGDLKLALELSDSALSEVDIFNDSNTVRARFIIQEDDLADLKANRSQLHTFTDHLFTNTLNAISIMIQVKQKNMAKETYRKAQDVFLFAKAKAIGLKPDDTLYLETLPKYLVNE